MTFEKIMHTLNPRNDFEGIDFDYYNSKMRGENLEEAIKATKYILPKIMRRSIECFGRGATIGLTSGLILNIPYADRPTVYFATSAALAFAGGFIDLTQFACRYYLNRIS